MQYVCETCEFATTEEAAAVSHAEGHMNVRLERDTTGKDSQVADYRCGKDEVAGYIHGLLKIHADDAAAAAGIDAKAAADAADAERTAANAPAPMASVDEQVRAAVAMGLEDTPSDPADKPL